MNHLQFQERLLHDNKIPAFVRLVASKAINDLKQNGGTIRVEPFTFWQLVKWSKARAVKLGANTCITIENENKTVFIQTKTK